MATHNMIIYHCIDCGKVVHEEPGKPSPTCCGKPMANAAAETVREGAPSSGNKNPPAGSAAGQAPAPKGPGKPR